MKTIVPVHSLRARDEFRASTQAEDRRRGAFLRALDESEYTVSDWEARFIEGFLDFTSNRPSDEPRWWTEPRRTACDRMMSHYPEAVPSSKFRVPSSEFRVPCFKP